MKHPRFTAWLCSAAALVLLAVPAFAQQPDALPPEQAAPAAQEQTAEAAAPDAEAPTAEAPAADPQRTYVALGDSIVSGVGLPDFKYTEAAIGIDAAPNFEGYPEQCYVSLVGKGLGLDRQHAINLGLPGLTTGDLADMLHTGAMPQMNQQAGTYYVYPQMLDYLKRADVISVQIGSNDALVPALVALGNATNWKSEQLVATMVSGVLREPSFENLQRLNSDLSRLRLTREERKATTQLLLGGGTGRHLRAGVSGSRRTYAAGRSGAAGAEPGRADHPFGLHEPCSPAAGVDTAVPAAERPQQEPCRPERECDLCAHPLCHDRRRRPPHRERA